MRNDRLACPMVSRSSGRNKTDSAFNEGISVPADQWKREVAKNPELASRDRETRFKATKKSILNGSLAKYRRR